jgi:hypothetical protein
VRVTWQRRQRLNLSALKILVRQQILCILVAGRSLTGQLCLFRSPWRWRHVYDYYAPEVPDRQRSSNCAKKLPAPNMPSGSAFCRSLLLVLWRLQDTGRLSVEFLHSKRFSSLAWRSKMCWNPSKAFPASKEAFFPLENVPQNQPASFHRICYVQ